jgi:hypothetical protein
MRKSGVFIAIAVAAVLSGCGGEAPAPAAEAVSAEPAAPEPVRLPIGEITKEDAPALMAAVYKDGVPDNVQDLGTVVLGERVALLTGADNAEACADCKGSLSLFYLVRMETGFLLQADHRDFHKSGSGGKFNRGIQITQFGGADGRPSYAGFTDVNRQACGAKTLTVSIFTEAGPRTALEAPFGSDKGDEPVDAMIIDPGPYQAEFAINYENPYEDFVAPYMFVNQSLRPSFPTPAWTRAAC